MHFDFSQNGAVIHIAPGESIILARRMLKGFRRFETRWIPPFPLGSPLFRIFYGSYFAMREVSAMATDEGGISIPVRGPHTRGNFHVLRLNPEERYFVSGKCIAGFSGTIRGLHTHIRFSLPYWIFRRHFFPVFEGPGEILLYNKSPFEETASTELEGERVVAFNIARSFLPAAPQPKKLFSRIHNLLWSREVIWQFVDPGTTVAEMHSFDERDRSETNFLWRWTKHLLGFLKF